MKSSYFLCKNMIKLVNLYFYISSIIERMQDMFDIVRDNLELWRGHLGIDQELYWIARFLELSVMEL